MPKNALESKINRAIGELPGGTRWLYSPETMSRGVSHALFTVQPSEGRESGIPVPASRYLGSLLFDKAVGVKLTTAREMLQIFQRAPQSRTSAWKVFELFALAALQRKGGTYPITPMDATGNTNKNLVVMPAGDTSRAVLSFQQDSELEALSSGHPGKVIIPMSSTFPTVDGMIFDARGRTWLLRLTIAKKHILRTSGLERLKRALPNKYQPNEKVKWKVVLVTLENESVDSAPIVGSEKEFWMTNTERYIMRVSEDTLFRD